MPSSNSQSMASDPNAVLVQLCIKVLKQISPNGMTTKELAAELDKEPHQPGFNGISSSILSSKLNAVFRRVHNDSPHPTQQQLSELPLTRSQSSDVPRRLVYRYTPSDIDDSYSQASNKRQLASQSDDEDVSLSPVLSSTEFSDDSHSEPMTPKEENALWANKKRKIGSIRSEQSGNVPDRPNTPPTISHRKYEIQVPKLNLYYDIVDYDCLSAALGKTITSPNLEKEPEGWAEDVASPEHLELNELDTMVC